MVFLAAKGATTNVAIRMTRHRSFLLRSSLLFKEIQAMNTGIKIPVFWLMMKLRPNNSPKRIYRPCRKRYRVYRNKKDNKISVPGMVHLPMHESFGRTPI